MRSRRAPAAGRPVPAPWHSRTPPSADSGDNAGSAAIGSARPRRRPPRWRSRRRHPRPTAQPSHRTVGPTMTAPASTVTCRPRSTGPITCAGGRSRRPPVGRCPPSSSRRSVAWTREWLRATPDTARIPSADSRSYAEPATARLCNLSPAARHVSTHASKLASKSAFQGGVERLPAHEEIVRPVLRHGRTETAHPHTAVGSRPPCCPASAGAAPGKPADPEPPSRPRHRRRWFPETAPARLADMHGKATVRKTSHGCPAPILPRPAASRAQRRHRRRPSGRGTARRSACQRPGRTQSDSAGFVQPIRAPGSSAA